MALILNLTFILFCGGDGARTRILEYHSGSASFRTLSHTPPTNFTKYGQLSYCENGIGRTKKNIVYNEIVLCESNRCHYMAMIFGKRGWQNEIQ